MCVFGGGGGGGGGAGTDTIFLYFPENEEIMVTI